MRLLFTGLSGFIGSNLGIDKFHNAKIYSLSRQHTGTSPAEIIIGNLENYQDILNALEISRPDAIVLMGATSSLYEVENNILSSYLINTKSVEYFIRAAHELTPALLPKILFFSTDLVYDSYKMEVPTGFKEADPPRPKSRYARTKLEAEHLLHFYPNSTILRIALTLNKDKTKNRGYLEFIDKSVIEEKPLSFYTDEWRTPIESSQIGQYLLELLSSTSPLPKLIHIAGKERFSRYEIGTHYLSKYHPDYTSFSGSSRRESELGRLRGMDCSLDSTLINTLFKR